MNDTINIKGVVSSAITSSTTTGSTNGVFSLNTDWGTNSNFIISNNVGTAITGVGTNAYKRSGAFRKTKKKPGDKTDTNNSGTNKKLK